MNLLILPSQAIRIRLTSASNGGRIDPGAGTYTLTIAPNDSPYGTVQLAADSFSVAESALDGPQTATVIRRCCTYTVLVHTKYTQAGFMRYMQHRILT